jgi:hypothetical protein
VKFEINLNLQKWLTLLEKEMNLDYIVSNGRKKNVLSVTPRDELKQVTVKKKKLIEEKKAAIAEAMKRIEEKEK